MESSFAPIQILLSFQTFSYGFVYIVRESVKVYGMS